MEFQDRRDAGRQLAQALKKYKGQKVGVFALPRGGVVTASEIADALDAPLDILLAHKIGHPYQPEYAIAAISEGGYLIENRLEIAQIDPEKYQQMKEHQMEEIRRKRQLYAKGKRVTDVEESIAILVDDGVATGLTMKTAILELKYLKPKKIVVAVPVSPKSTAHELESMADEFLGLIVPEDWEFRGAIGAYYRDFSQVEDQEVISLLEASQQREKTR